MGHCSFAPYRIRFDIVQQDCQDEGDGRGLFFLGMAVYIVTAFDAIDPLRNDDVFIALMSFPVASVAISDLIAIPILRRRVRPPCVRVKRLFQGGHIALSVIVSFLFIAFFVSSLVNDGTLRSLGPMTFLGLTTVSLVIWLILFLLEKIEICGNGVWQGGKFQPWEEFKSFSWQWKTKDSAELRLVLKSWIWPTRLVVPPEDREAVHQLLEGNIPDLSK